MNQPTVNNDPASASQEIDLRELFATLWSGKWMIVLVTFLFAAAIAAVVILIPNQYKATAVLAPASGGNVGGLSSQLGGLASLAGVTLGTPDSDESQIAMEVLKSWSFVDSFIRRNDLQIEVFAVDGWDRNANRLHIDETLYDMKTGKWVRTPPKDKTVEPTSWELYDKFSNMLSVSQDKKTGLVSVSIEYYSPFVAKQWVDLLIQAINDHMRVRKLESSSQNIEYLQAQIDKTPIADMKEVFYKLIENEIKNKMLAEASPEYQFVAVSAAMVPEEKSKPKRMLIVALATLLGGMCGFLFVLARRAFVVRGQLTE